MNITKIIKAFREKEYGLFLDTEEQPIGASISFNKKTGHMQLFEGSVGLNGFALSSLKSFYIKENSVYIKYISKYKEEKETDYYIGTFIKEQEKEAIEWVEKCNKVLREL